MLCRRRFLRNAQSAQFASGGSAPYRPESRWGRCSQTRRKAAIEFVTQGLQAGALKPVIDRTFTFDAMADVHRYLEQSGQFGKIVVTV